MGSYTMFVMVVTDTEHPPAAGTVLDFAAGGHSSDAAIAVVTGALVMSGGHNFLRPIPEASSLASNRPVSYCMLFGVA